MRKHTAAAWFTIRPVRGRWLVYSLYLPDPCQSSSCSCWPKDGCSGNYQREISEI